MNQVVVKLINQNNHAQIVSLYYPNTRPWFIEMSCEELPITRYEGHDLFRCFRELRSKLDVFGIKVLCNGARIDATVSGMLSDSGARKVYLTTMGQHARLEDLVNIFDEADPEKVGTVEEQDNYHNKWVVSF